MSRSKNAQWSSVLPGEIPPPANGVSGIAPAPAMPEETHGLSRSRPTRARSIGKPVKAGPKEVASTGWKWRIMKRELPVAIAAITLFLATGAVWTCLAAAAIVYLIIRDRGLLGERW